MLSPSFLLAQVLQGFLVLSDEGKQNSRGRLFESLRSYQKCKKIDPSIDSIIQLLLADTTAFSRLDPIQIEVYLEWIVGKLVGGMDPDKVALFGRDLLPPCFKSEAYPPKKGIYELLEPANLIFHVENSQPVHGCSLVYREKLTNWIYSLINLFRHRDGPCAKKAIIHGAKRRQVPEALKRLSFEIYSNQLGVPVPDHVVKRMSEVSGTRVISRETPGKVLGLGRQIKIAEIEQGMSRANSYLIVLKIDGLGDVFALVNTDWDDLPEHGQHTKEKFYKANRLSPSSSVAWLDWIVSSEAGSSCLKNYGVSSLGVVLSLIAMLLAEKVQTLPNFYLPRW